MKAPCKDCKDRKVTDGYNCHSHCDKYLAYHAYRESVYEKKKPSYTHGSLKDGGITDV